MFATKAQVFSVFRAIHVPCIIQEFCHFLAACSVELSANSSSFTSTARCKFEKNGCHVFEINLNWNPAKIDFKDFNSVGPKITLFSRIPDTLSENPFQKVGHRNVPSRITVEGRTQGALVLSSTAAVRTREVPARPAPRGAGHTPVLRGRGPLS